MERGKRGKRGTGLEGEEGGRMREKGWEERGPKAHSRETLMCAPMIKFLCTSGLSKFHARQATPTAQEVFWT